MFPLCPAALERAASVLTGGVAAPAPVTTVMCEASRVGSPTNVLEPIGWWEGRLVYQSDDRTAKPAFDKAGSWSVEGVATAIIYRPRGVRLEAVREAVE